MSQLLHMSEAASLAFHTMSLLARHKDRRFLNLEVADYLVASEHTLAKVFQRLRKAELVRSVRGPSGGFELAREPETIQVLEIYEAIDGRLSSCGCVLGKGECISQDCLLGGLAAKVYAMVRETFENTTLDAFAASMKLGDKEYGVPQDS